VTRLHSIRRRLGIRFAVWAVLSLAAGILTGAMSERFGFAFVLVGFGAFLYYAAHATAFLIGRPGLTIDVFPRPRTVGTPPPGGPILPVPAPPKLLGFDPRHRRDRVRIGGSL